MMKTDVLIVGAGCAGLYSALQLPRNKQILMIAKADLDSSDSMLAQGGICMLKSEADYESFYEDTMRAGHFENDRGSVEIMIRSSQEVIQDLIRYGTRFERESDGSLAFTREGAHSDKRILYHEDITGKEITTHLLAEARTRSNITILDHTTMLDLITADNVCYGAVIRKSDGAIDTVEADDVILACGGIGGLYEHSTNFRILTGDALAIALKHDIHLQNINYVQIHPTTFYNEDPNERSFLISESVRGEGAKLYDKNGQRFANELLPRDLLTEEIRKQMAKDGTKHVWEDLRPLGEEVLKKHFPNILQHCIDAGYDPLKEPIPVVPAQHYFMGGIWVDYNGHTSMKQLYAAGETACNGVHGKNRLASNSLLESLVWAKRSALEIARLDGQEQHNEKLFRNIDLSEYSDPDALEAKYHKMVQDKIDEANEGRPSAAAYRIA